MQTIDRATVRIQCDLEKGRGKGGGSNLRPALGPSRRVTYSDRTQNPVKEWIETKMIPDSVAIDEFLHSQDFRKLFVNELGDSLAIRFGLSIEPMQWSQYNYQIVYSDYYIMPSEKIYESFIEKSE